MQLYLKVWNNGRLLVGSGHLNTPISRLQDRNRRLSDRPGYVIGVEDRTTAIIRWEAALTSATAAITRSREIPPAE